MPRFLDSHIACLKRAMLRRIPECYFLTEDYPAITQETGLCHAQIEKWAEHLRYRLPVANDRETFLRATGETDKVIPLMSYPLASNWF